MACGILGVVLVVGRDGWLAIFLGVAIPTDITLLPMLCLIVLPAWLLVSRVPEFRIVAAPAPARARRPEPDDPPPPEARPTPLKPPEPPVHVPAADREDLIMASVIGEGIGSC